MTAQKKEPEQYLLEDSARKIFDSEQLSLLIAFVRPWKTLAFFSLIALLFAEAIPFVYPIIFQRLVDGPISSANMGEISRLSGLFLLLVCVQAVALYLKTILSQLLGLNVIHDLRTRLFSHVQGLSLRFFHKTPVGRLMTRMSSDVDTLNSLFTEGFIDLASAVLMLIFAVFFMFLQDWRLALATLAVFPFMTLATAVFRVKVRNINVVIRAKLAALNSILQEGLNGISLVQLFRKEKQRYDKFESINRDYRDAFMRNVLYYSLFFPIITGLSELSTLTAIFFGGWLIHQGTLGAGTLVAFVWYAGMFTRPLREISDKLTRLQTAMAAGERVFHLLNTTAKTPDGNEQAPAGSLSVEFQQVNFSYQSNQPILKDISFRVNAGETVAVVGATGAGKSTLFTLLNRFYLPDSGNILLGEKDLSALQSSSWRQRVANVSQEIFLFSDTIRNNIIMGAPLNEELLQESCELSRAQSVIERMHGGLDHVLEQGGRKLSLGERQLLSFARALYSQPDLLLLDEATSSVDSWTENLIRQAMGELTKGRTAIVIAHRLSTVVQADKIFVLHKGELVESGKHNELLKEDGIYAKLVRLQGMAD